nr:hypothetical protein [Tanacetum cinerariifolium]
MRIEQYFLMTDYSLWEVIINGDSTAPTVVIDGVVQPVTILSADQKLAKRNELKAHVSAATCVSAVYVKFPVSSHPNVDSLSNIDVDDLEEMDLRWQWSVITATEKDISSGSAGQSCSKACLKAYDKLHSQYDKLTVEFCKSQIDVLSYQAGLESVKARLVVYKQNESILQENINMLRNEVQARDNVLVTLKQKLNQVEKERDDLKLKFDKFQTSSKNLTELLARQTNNKQGLGYFSSESDSESLSLSCPSDRLQPSGGYNDVPPPIIGNFMPLKPDLVFHNAPLIIETNHLAFTVQLSPAKPAEDLSNTTRPMAPIIKDWLSDSEDESKPNDPQSVPIFVQTSKHVKPSGHSVKPIEAPILAATPNPTSPKTNSSGKRKNRKTCFVCRSVDHLI